MGKNIQHLQHVKSSVVENGKPKLPTADKLVDGELAVNYAKDVETISLRNSSGEVVTFSSDNYYTEKKLGYKFIGENSGNTVSDVIDEDEEIVASALNDLESRKLDVSAHTSDLSNYYTKSETSGSTEIETALSAKSDKTWVEEKLGSGFTGDNSANTVTSIIREDELIIASSLNDINSRLSPIETDITNKVDKESGKGLSTNDYTTAEKNKLAEIAAGAEVNVQSDWNETDTNSDAFINNKPDIDAEITARIGSVFTSGNTVQQVIEDNEEVVASAFNDLEARKLNADVIWYGTEAEYSGLTGDEKASIIAFITD